MFAKDMNTVILLDIYGNLLTENQYRVLSLYYEDDLSLGEIASQTNITRQAVSETVRRGDELLKKYESALNIAKKYKQIKEKLDRISDLAEQSDNLEIKELADECKKLI